MPSVEKPAKVNTLSLKDQNRPAITGVLAANLVVLTLLLTTGHLTTSDARQLVAQWQSLLPAGIAVAFAAVVNGLLSSETKARLVFWRWRDPLPGSRAFSDYAQHDPRIDVKSLRKKLTTWPSEPHEQNSLWYKLYKAFEREPAVIGAHRYFLLTRDYAAISFLILASAIPLSFWFIPSLQVIGTYAGLLLAQYLLVRQAAFNYGIGFVTNVLALKAANK